MKRGKERRERGEGRGREVSWNGKFLFEQKQPHTIGRHVKNVIVRTLPGSQQCQQCSTVAAHRTLSGRASNRNQSAVLRACIRRRPKRKKILLRNYFNFRSYTVSFVICFAVLTIFLKKESRTPPWGFTASSQKKVKRHCVVYPS